MTTYDNFIVWTYNHSLYILVWMHFFMDFVCQSNQMALNKSKSNKWLAYHIVVYTLPFLFWGVKFALINGVAHFFTDYYTSRFSSKMWKRGVDGDPFGYRLFWVCIGFDQALHLTVLLYTAQYLLFAF
jgi:hypothetical protein